MVYQEVLLDNIPHVLLSGILFGGPRRITTEPPATVADGSEYGTLPLPRASAQATRPDGCAVTGGFL